MVLNLCTANNAGDPWSWKKSPICVLKHTMWRKLTESKSYDCPITKTLELYMGTKSGLKNNPVLVPFLGDCLWTQNCPPDPDNEQSRYQGFASPIGYTNCARNWEPRNAWFLEVIWWPKWGYIWIYCGFWHKCLWKTNEKKDRMETNLSYNVLCTRFRKRGKHRREQELPRELEWKTWRAQKGPKMKMRSEMGLIMSGKDEKKKRKENSEGGQHLVTYSRVIVAPSWPTHKNRCFWKLLISKENGRPRLWNEHSVETERP